MGYIVSFIVIMLIFSMLKDRRSAEQSKFRKTGSAASDGPIHYYGDYDNKDDAWKNHDSSYDGGSDGGFDGGGGGGD
ncbi:hypothetical protein [Planomicrobium sp. MB-3u-38]|uniref:hypothetical protein n=1 Tax=Planomicrobium sp. MB-3u-38 TaxID=2058318 RepID=UPI000C7D5F24|nr:hypothetical protein [Planomicrobium sp. MB-3u-38]PKH09745.1 hypothetical protein CXF70_13280 [Planomicrobium sp. MB-3u-38]